MAKLKLSQQDTCLMDTLFGSDNDDDYDAFGNMVNYICRVS